MNQIKKILILSIIAIASFGFVSCDDTSSTTIVESTTSYTTEVETTVVTTLITTDELTTSESTTVVTTTYVDQSRIEIVAPTKLEYSVNQTLDLTGMIVTYYDADNNPRVLREGVYTVSEVDMSTSGEKVVTITFLTYQATFLIQITIPSYYASTEGLNGNALFLELRTIIQTGFEGVTYGDARDILAETDKDPNNSNNLILVYLGTSVSGAWDEGITWNREHVWPQSGMPDSAVNEVVNMASDLQNLKPANPSENSSRGNKWFDYVPTTSSVAYEPRDAVKGDIARILLYMVVMYDELTLVDSYPNIYSYEMGILSTLLEWNRIDPVDDFEMNRNNIIYSYQHNRNPFIDYSEFADLIWEQ